MAQDCNKDGQVDRGPWTTWFLHSDMAQPPPPRYLSNQVNMSLLMLQGKTELAPGCVQFMRDLSGPCPAQEMSICFEHPPETHLPQP